MIAKLVYYNDKLWSKIQRGKKTAVLQRLEFSPQRYLDELIKERHLQKQSTFVLSIDDTSMKSSSIFSSDNGVDKKGAVRTFLKKFIEEETMPTLYFVPSPTYAYLSDAKRVLRKANYDISHYHEHEFVEWLKTHQNNQKVEVAVHGFNHINQELKGYHSFEFDGISPSEIRNRLFLGYSKMSEIFDIYGFKPPAWSIGQLKSNESQFLREMSKLDSYRYVSLSSPTNGLNYQSQRVSHIHVSKISGLNNVPQNISILWPIEYTKMVIDEIVEKGGVINVQLHSQQTFNRLTDGLCNENYTKTLLLRDYAVRMGAKPQLTKDLCNDVTYYTP